MITGNEPANRVEQLRAERAECQRVADRIAAELGGRPLLRERNWFFHQLLNSDLDTYERVRPLWLAQRRNTRTARGLGREIDSAVRRRVAEEPRYRELTAKAGREKEARRAGKRLLRSIRAAKQRTGRVTSGGFSPSTTKRDARDVSRHLRTVHRRADALTATLTSGAPDAGALAKLHVTFSSRTTAEEWKKQYVDIQAALSSLERAVDAIMREARAREKKVTAQQRQYLRDGQVRYNR